ncbi:MAG: ATP-binding cassette domain-containing protein [Acidobacteriota bacterium]
MDDALFIDGVTKRFGPVLAVDDFSMRVPQGTICGFLGQNGAGKTTTLRMVMSILYPDSGTLRVLGRSPEAIKDRLGYLPEEKGLYKKMTAGEMLAYFARLKGMPGREARRRAHDLLSELGLGDWVGKRCEALSKGMGQKVQVLGTLIHEPDLVILDEPFSGLDPVNVEVMRELILRMRREGRTVIFSTHVMAQAEQLCDTIVLIHRGRKLIDGPLAEVKASGERGILLDYDGDGAVLENLPGVLRINDAGKQAELHLEENADPQAILERLVAARLTIRRFDLREPSLHEIFVRAVGGEAHV